MEGYKREAYGLAENDVIYHDVTHINDVLKNASFPHEYTQRLVKKSSLAEVHQSDIIKHYIMVVSDSHVDQLYHFSVA